MVRISLKQLIVAFFTGQAKLLEQVTTFIYCHSCKDTYIANGTFAAKVSGGYPQC
ncbi:MAG: hypothetical protein AAF821_04790 [Cyanobacteria bacterium P01_D01_bin.156]